MSTPQDDIKQIMQNKIVKNAVSVLNDNKRIEEAKAKIETVRSNLNNLAFIKDRELLDNATQQRIVNNVNDVISKLTELATIPKTLKKVKELKISFRILHDVLKEKMQPKILSPFVSGLLPATTEAAVLNRSEQFATELVKPYEEAFKELEKVGIKEDRYTNLQSFNTPGKESSPTTSVNKSSSPDGSTKVETTSSTTPDQSPTDLPTQDQSPKEKEDVIALIFNLLYFVGGIIAALLVVILFILASFDLLKFNITAITQYISLLNNPNMYNKDTQDFKALMYYRNSTDTEPYTIFGQQELIKLMFTLGTSVVGIVMIQVFILVFLLFVYRVIMKKPLEMGYIDFKQSAKPLGTVLIVVILAFIWSGLYHARFVNSIQPSIIYTHNNIEQVKNYIYDNLTTNEAFLTNLINGDLNECIQIMNQQTNDNRIVRMIYTMSVYNFFKINISENEEAFNTVIRDIFTLAEIRVRSVNPINYMYYNQNVFLPNLYPIVRQYIFGTNKAISTSARDKIIRLDITQRINETNKRLMTLFKVPERKTQLRNYFYVAFIISLVFLFIVYGLYKDSISKLLGENLIDKIKEVIFLVFLVGTREVDKKPVTAPTAATTS